MSAYSIYQKPCPHCGVMVAIEVGRCDCGYSFQTARAEDDTGQASVALQEEELFEAYLTARIDQAVAALELARAEFTVDTANRRKTDKLILALQEALSLREEREAQAVRVSELRASLPHDLNAPSDQPTEAFRAQQSARAEKIMEGFNNTETKTCPHCKTVLPVTSVLCPCGYIYARNDFMLPRAVDNSMRGALYHSKHESPDDR